MLLVLPKARSRTKDLNKLTTMCLHTTSSDNMSKITVSVPKELKKQLDQYPELNWPEILRRGLREKLKKLKRYEQVEGEL